MRVREVSNPLPDDLIAKFDQVSALHRDWGNEKFVQMALIGIHRHWANNGYDQELLQRLLNGLAVYFNVKGKWPEAMPDPDIPYYMLLLEIAHPELRKWT